MGLEDFFWTWEGGGEVLGGSRFLFTAVSIFGVYVVSSQVVIEGFLLEVIAVAGSSCCKTVSRQSNVCVTFMLNQL